MTLLWGLDRSPFVASAQRFEISDCGLRIRMLMTQSGTAPLDHGTQQLLGLIELPQPAQSSCETVAGPQCAVVAGSQHLFLRRPRRY